MKQLFKDQLTLAKFKKLKYRLENVLNTYKMNVLFDN